MDAVVPPEELFAMVTTWPTTFRVGLTLPGFRRGGGTLWVAPGSIVCIPGRLTALADHVQPVAHQGNQVDIYTTRLVPPWFNVTVPIRGAGGTLLAVIWILGRRKLRQTIQAAGFDVTEHVTWFDHGSGTR
jgi:hypothetical protein